MAEGRKEKYFTLIKETMCRRGHPQTKGSKERNPKGFH